MGDIKQKACYRPNLKPWKDPSVGINKQETWHTDPEDWNFNCKRDETCCILKNGVICQTSPWGSKNKMSLKKQTYALGRVRFAILFKFILRQF